jgi:hypothetical protein
VWDCVVRQGDLRVTDDGGRDGDDDVRRMLKGHDAMDFRGGFAGDVPLTMRV